jgi:hypothetical protein
MNILNIPGFTANHSLETAHGRYHNSRSIAVQPNTVMPAIPRCENCDFILANCEVNGWKPRAACNACNSGRCDSGEENSGGHCRIDHATGGIICDV